jgi:hypothetical protein
MSEKEILAQCSLSEVIGSISTNFDHFVRIHIGNAGIRFLLPFAGFKSTKRLKKLQKSLLFIDDKHRETTMIAGHLKKQGLRNELCRFGKKDERN